MAFTVLGTAAARAGTLGFDPPTVPFGTVSVSAGQTFQQLTITNSGSTTTITGFTSGPGCSEFSAIAAGLPVALSNGASLVVTVIYDPVNRGSDACSFTVQDDNGVTDAFGTTGTGIAPVLSVSPATLDFSDQPWSSGTGETLYVTLSNFGEEAIAQSNLQTSLLLGTQFSVGTGGPFPITSGGVASLPVTFNPTSQGLKSDALILGLNNDSPDAPNWTVDLTGRGIEEPVSVGDFRPDTPRLTVRPSPSRGSVTISYSVPSTGRLRVEALDLSGRVVARLTATAQSAGIRADALQAGVDWKPAPGLYFARVSLNGTVLGVQRFLVAR